MVKIKKQYKQADGTIIEVEGTEAEIEGFEKKQTKQKAQIEQSERKKTILYGKDLEEIRKIVREELAKQARPIVYEYRYFNYPYYQPQWSLGPVIYGQSSTCGAINTTDNKITCTTNTTADAGQLTYTSAPAVYAAQGHGQANSIASMSSVVSSVLDVGSINAKNTTKLLGGTNPNFEVGKSVQWSGGGSSNFLMSPRT